MARLTPGPRVMPVTSVTRGRRAARSLMVPVASLIAYFVVRPLVGSDAAGLAVAGAVPAVCTIALVLAQRRVDLWAAAISVGYGVGCVVSLLAGGSSLPLKLHEAALTFLLGVVLLGAVLVRCPSAGS
jgi:mannose/fructose/N-acetylgalactosamine-specific phosphotransferase system component IID